MNIKPISRKQNIVVQELENELLVYDLKINKAFCLNETSAIIYQLCDGTKTISEISDLMSRNLKILVSEDFVKLALNELNRDGLLENSAEFNNYFAGMSRREMVKKVGLASMIALPLVSSVIAPTAVNAQSCTPNGAFCNFDNFNQGDCCPNSVCFYELRSFFCANCVPSGSSFVLCAGIGSCGNCNNVSNKNLCCNSSAPATNNGTNCLCG